MAHIAGAFAIPAFLVVALLWSDTSRPGRHDSALASSVATQVLEQALAFVLIACLVVSFQALSLRAHAMRPPG
jgi:hypothetical protein